ncbi:MAG: hypothetical protein MJZ32_05735 [Bacteroidaceae bacterium]|nr:hypothetical protein [Bacteroidaceae bacterium]
MKSIKLFIAMLMLSASTMVMAQQEPKENGRKRPTQEQMVDMQWQRVAKKLMLSDAQSAKVKPIYEAYMKEMKETFPAEGRLGNPRPTEAGKQKPEAPKQMTDAEVSAKVKQQFAAERKRLDVQEKYFDKFCKELNPRQAQFLLKSVGMRNHGGKNGFHGRSKQGMQFNGGMRGGNRGNGKMFGNGRPMIGPGARPQVN